VENQTGTVIALLHNKNVGFSKNGVSVCVSIHQTAKGRWR